MRFYPADVPAFQDEPTRDRFDIRAFEDGQGEGVVTLVPFAAGDIVFAFTGHLVAERTLRSLQVEPSLHVDDPHFMGKVLHCCEPNCVVDMSARRFIANRAIAAGETVTMDYEQTEDALFREFNCRCGASRCRGQIAGRVQGKRPARRSA